MMYRAYLLYILSTLLLSHSIKASVKLITYQKSKQSTQLYAIAFQKQQQQAFAAALTTTPTAIRGEYNDNDENMFSQIGNKAYEQVSTLAEFMMFSNGKNVTKKFLPVQAALQKIQKDMEFLDDVAGRTPQLSAVEFTILVSTVLMSAISPIVFSSKIAELLVPSMAAVSAAIGISAEYAGKVAVANGKETAAAAIQATAESEILLAQSERVKAVLPLCVGIATTASAFSLLAPSLAAEIASKASFNFANEFFLFFPLVAVLAAAISGLATQECLGLATTAIGTGNRRFASSNSVGRTWLSATEQIMSNSKRTSQKWSSFAIGVAPAPLFAALFPGRSDICILYDVYHTV